MSGRIDAAFSKLTNLEILDLSNNELTGDLPEFLAQLPRLKILNLSRNNLTGLIPESLKEKSHTSLKLSLDGNLGLCQTGSCKSNKKKWNVKLIVSIAATVAVLIIVSVVVLIFRTRGPGPAMFPKSNMDEQLNTKCRAFSYSEVVSMTDDFRQMIGKGGFGKVYLGLIPDGENVAVKTLSLSELQGHKEFISEVNLLMPAHHRNVVSLVGYCADGGIRALIFEYLPGGNLQQRLSDKNPNVLEWNERLQIAFDVANGLEYLHNGCKPAIIHRDLKPPNILLDENTRAKISDFGLSRAFANDSDTHILTNCFAGSHGYIDPEFQNTGILNKKSDVYSLGVVLLELVTGQPALIGTPNNYIHILPWVNRKLEIGDVQGIVDPRLQGEYNRDSAWKLIETAMSCLSQFATQRPDIKEIVSELKDCLSLVMPIERSASQRRSLSVKGSMQIEINESDICGPNPR